MGGVGRSHWNARDEEDFRKPIGLEVLDFGERRSDLIKKIKTLFTKLNIVCYISLHRDYLINQ